MPKSRKSAPRKSAASAASKQAARHAQAEKLVQVAQLAVAQIRSGNSSEASEAGAHLYDLVEQHVLRGHDSLVEHALTIATDLQDSSVYSMILDAAEVEAQSEEQVLGVLSQAGTEGALAPILSTLFAIPVFFSDLGKLRARELPTDGNFKELTASLGKAGVVNETQRFVLVPYLYSAPQLTSLSFSHVRKMVGIITESVLEAENDSADIAEYWRPKDSKEDFGSELGPVPGMGFILGVMLDSDIGGEVFEAKLGDDSATNDKAVEELKGQMLQWTEQSKELLTSIVSPLDEKAGVHALPPGPYYTAVRTGFSSLVKANATMQVNDILRETGATPANINVILALYDTGAGYLEAAASLVSAVDDELLGVVDLPIFEFREIDNVVNIFTTALESFGFARLEVLELIIDQIHCGDCGGAMYVSSSDGKGKIALDHILPASGTLH